MGRRSEGRKYPSPQGHGQSNFLQSLHKGFPFSWDMAAAGDARAGPRPRLRGPWKCAQALAALHAASRPRSSPAHYLPRALTRSHEYGPVHAQRTRNARWGESKFTHTHTVRGIRTRPAGFRGTTCPPCPRSRDCTAEWTGWSPAGSPDTGRTTWRTGRGRKQATAGLTFITDTSALRPRTQATDTQAEHVRGPRAQTTHA